MSDAEDAPQSRAPTNDDRKLCLMGFDRFIGKADLKQEFDRTISKDPQKDFAFVVFESIDDKEAAQPAIEMMSVRGKAIRWKTVHPRKRLLPSEDSAPRKRRATEDVADDMPEEASPGEGCTVEDVVTPLWRLDYEEQKSQKEASMSKTLVRMCRRLRTKTCKGLDRKHVERKVKTRDENPTSSFVMDARLPSFMYSSPQGHICPLQSLLVASQVEGYRNKCDFTVGFDESHRVTIGFRLASFSDGLGVLGHVQNCRNVHDKMKDFVREFEGYLSTSALAPYDLVSHAGFWRTVTCRYSSRNDSMMIVIRVNLLESDQEKWCEERPAALKWFADRAGPLSLKSLYLHKYTGLSMPMDGNGLELIWGEQFITESLLSLRFSLSPTSFFQVNTEAAEKLYQSLKDHCKHTSQSVILDICCGTGTIGLCFAKEVKKVIGIELSASAVEDARHNADLNEVTNAVYIQDRVENVISNVLDQSKKYITDEDTDLIAIVDPPRCGLHANVIRALRLCRRISRILYVSCNPTGSLADDLESLCLPPTKSYAGQSFYPTVAQPVDLFPHTNHCELVVVLERLEFNWTACE